MPSDWLYVGSMPIEIATTPLPRRTTMRQVQAIAALALVTCVLPARSVAQAAPATGAKPGKIVTQKTNGAKSRAKSCQVEGVWELVSTTTTDGQDRRLANGYRQRKMVSRGHFMWIGADAKRDTIGLHTLSDSLRSTQVSGGTGTYTLNGNNYTEHLEIFLVPTMEGQSFPATCRMEGDRWYHSYPPDSAKKTVEVWRRI